jgi:rubrerythrin
VSLVNRLLCRAMLQEVIGRVAEQALALLWASWAAEDSGDVELARRCRSDAADLLLSRRPALRRFERYPGSGTVVLSDLLRRSGRIDEALRVVNAALEPRPANPITELLLVFERQLCERGETAGYTEADAFEALTGKPSLWEPEPAYDTATAEYLQRYHGELLTAEEDVALRARRVRTLRGVMWNSDEAAVLELLEHGKDALLRAIEQRLLAEHPGRFFMNRCPRCGRLARTPQAKQCPHCGHSWRS